MISPPDPFALNFDSIPIEPRRCLDPVGGEFSPESPPGPAPAALTYVSASPFRIPIARLSAAQAQLEKPNAD